MCIVVITIHNISAFLISTESFPLISLYHYPCVRTSVLTMLYVTILPGKTVWQYRLAIHPSTLEDGGILALKC